MKKCFLSVLFAIISMTFLNSINLEKSIEIARKNNKEILSRTNALHSAKWKERNAITNFLPKLNFNSTIVRIDDDTYQKYNAFNIPGMDLPPSMLVYKTTYTNNLTLRQPIFNGGKLILGYQLAKLAQKQTENALSEKEKELDSQVATTYFNYLKLKDLLELSRKSLNSTKQHLQQVRKNFEVGLAKKSDVLQWQVKLQNDKTSLNEIENNLESLVSIWRNLLGLNEPVELPDKIDVKKYDEEISVLVTNDKETEIQSFLNQVKKNNLSLKSLEISQKMLKKNYCLAKSNFLPSFNLQFSYEIEKDDKLDFSGEENWNLAAIVSVPLFTSFANFTNLKEAKYDLKKNKFLLEDTAEKILIAAENSFYKLTNAAESVENNKIALEFAKENHKIINELYKQKMITNTELLDAEVMLFASEMNLISSYYDFIIQKYETEKFK